MNPLDFLEVADTLKDSPQEAERRTAVSRAYYSVFHFIKNYLKEHRIHVPYPEHDPLVRYIKNSGIEKADMLYQMLADLKEERNRADYRLDLSGEFNEFKCTLLYLKAQKAIQESQNCKGRPLIDGINNYRRRIGEA